MMAPARAGPLARLFSGRAEAGLEAAARALQVRPNWWTSLEVLICCYTALGKWDEARRCARQMDKTTRRCLGASQDSQSRLGGRDEQCLAESFGINAADIPVAMSASAQMRGTATSVIFPLLCERRKSDRHRLCDNEGMPLICPTCQVLAQSVLTGDRLLLCMGLFSIFLVGSQSDAAWLRESA